MYKKYYNKLLTMQRAPLPMWQYERIDELHIANDKPISKRGDGLPTENVVKRSGDGWPTNECNRYVSIL